MTGPAGAGIEPDWVIGTSIGAINASLVAGNPPEMRLERLREFWDGVRHNPFAQMLGTAPFLGIRQFPEHFRPDAKGRNHRMTYIVPEIALATRGDIVGILDLQEQRHPLRVGQHVAITGSRSCSYVSSNAGGACPLSTRASFQARLIMSWMPVFMP